jgi:hypothetical protein
MNGYPSGFDLAPEQLLQELKLALGSSSTSSSDPSTSSVLHIPGGTQHMVSF